MGIDEIDEAGTFAGLLAGGSIFSHYWNLVAGIDAGLAARLTKWAQQGKRLP